MSTASTSVAILTFGVRLLVVAADEYVVGLQGGDFRFAHAEPFAEDGAVVFALVAGGVADFRGGVGEAVGGLHYGTGAAGAVVYLRYGAAGGGGGGVVQELAQFADVAPGDVGAVEGGYEVGAGFVADEPGGGGFVADADLCFEVGAGRGGVGYTKDGDELAPDVAEVAGEHDGAAGGVPYAAGAGGGFRVVEDVVGVVVGEDHGVGHGDVDVLATSAALAHVEGG